MAVRGREPWRGAPGMEGRALRKGSATLAGGPRERAAEHSACAPSDDFSRRRRLRGEAALAREPALRPPVAVRELGSALSR